jgi:hypothetical protein
MSSYGLYAAQSLEGHPFTVVLLTVVGLGELETIPRAGLTNVV